MGIYYIHQLFWALENGFLNAGALIDGEDVHQGFNPCHGNIAIPKPFYETQVQHTTDSLDPDPELSFAKAFNPGNASFPNGEGMTYRDPYLMCSVFEHKTITGDWSGGAGTYGKITGDFSDIDDKDSIMIQYGKTDGTTPIDRCLNGVIIENHSLGFKKGGILRELVELKACDVHPNTQAFVPAATYDDGRWADWARTAPIPATACKVYWDDSHAAEFAGLKIEEFKMNMKVPKETQDVSDDLKHQYEWSKNRNFEATVKGIVIGNAEYLEVEKAYKDKAKKDLRLSWDQTANELKWSQLDNAWIEKFSSYELVSIQERHKVDLTLYGTTGKFEGNYNNLPTPAGRITVTV